MQTYIHIFIMFVNNIFIQKYSELQQATITLKGFFKCHKKYLLMAQRVRLNLFCYQIADWKILSLSQSHRSCLLDVAEAIGDRTETLLDTQQIDLRETTYLIFSMTWFGCSDLGLDDQANTDLYLALQQLTHPLVKRLKASDLEWMIKKNIT